VNTRSTPKTLKKGHDYPGNPENKRKAGRVRLAGLAKDQWSKVTSGNKGVTKGRIAPGRRNLFRKN